MRQRGAANPGRQHRLSRARLRDLPLRRRTVRVGHERPRPVDAAPTPRSRNVDDPGPAPGEVEPDPPLVVRVLLAPVHRAPGQPRSRTVPDDGHLREKLRDVDRSEQPVRRLVLRAKRKRRGPRLGTPRPPAQVPHVHHAAPGPRDDRLSVVAGPRAVERRVAVRRRGELRPGLAPRAPIVPEVHPTPSPRREHPVTLAGAEQDV
mmetsp:Transcript_724/g.3087  ORF Transcript_724/g.3087 Transcript_724/m.3087 type:complete len:205 (-) Transcript_724:1064-1678(-)